MLRRAHHELQTRYSMLSVQAQLTETTLTEAAQAAVTNNNDLRQQLATLVRLYARLGSFLPCGATMSHNRPDGPVCMCVCVCRYKKSQRDVDAARRQISKQEAEVETATNHARDLEGRLAFLTGARTPSGQVQPCGLAQCSTTRPHSPHTHTNNAFLLQAVGSGIGNMEMLGDRFASAAARAAYSDMVQVKTRAEEAEVPTQQQRP